MKKIIITLAIVLGMSFSAYAAGTDVKLVWDPPSPLGDVAGYRVYKSQTSGQYTKGAANAACSSTVGTNTCTIPSMLDGTWFWVATAFDAAGNESEYSNEVTKTLDSTPPAAPTGLTVSVTVNVSVNP